MPRRWSSVGDPYLNSANAGPLVIGVQVVPQSVCLHPSFECGSSDAPSRLDIVGRFSKGNPITWRDCSLSSGALERTEMMDVEVYKPHNICQLPQHPVIGHLPAGRRRERRPALSLFVPSPINKPVRLNPGEHRSKPRTIVGVQMEIRI
jgi:hypothetical protein